MLLISSARRAFDTISPYFDEGAARHAQQDVVTMREALLVAAFSPVACRYAQRCLYVYMMFTAALCFRAIIAFSRHLLPICDYDG